MYQDFDSNNSASFGSDNDTPSEEGPSDNSESGPESNEATSEESNTEGASIEETQAQSPPPKKFLNLIRNPLTGRAESEPISYFNNLQLKLAKAFPLAQLTINSTTQPVAEDVMRRVIETAAGDDTIENQNREH